MLNVVMMILIAGAAYWVVSPLLRPARPETLERGRDVELQQLELRKEGTLATIKEMEFDLSMGKISEEDFQELKEQYANDAVSLMKKIKELNTGTKKRANKAAKGLKQTKKAVPKKQGRFCRQCGAAVSLNDKFCVTCGNKLGDSV